MVIWGPIQGEGQKVPTRAGTSTRLQPADLEYIGAFRLPDGTTAVKSWLYGGTGMTYYPNGDPSGPNDGFPGSLFAVGHDWEHQVSEISIPKPKVSASKNVNDLNTAAALQAFQDILDVKSVEMPRSDLEYLPPQGSQTSGKIYYCRGGHLQDENDLTHGWFDTNLTKPNRAGLWGIKNRSAYSVSDYLFEIPESWANVYTPGKRLATGRFRDGGWSGQGPMLFAFGPWNQGNPPAAGTLLENIPLIQYTSTLDFDSTVHTMNDYHHSDEWSGGAWLTSGSKSAVVFVGTKGTGNCWYGFGNGVVWPDEPPYPPIPDPPYNVRGWWSTGFKGVFIFYDTDRLADVAAGKSQPWEPQPYAAMDVDSYLYNVTGTQQKSHFGAAAFDRQRGYFYVMEYLADNEKPLVHVWKIKSSPETKPKISVSRKELCFGYSEYSGPTPAQKFILSNTGGGTLSFTLTTGSSWIDMAPRTLASNYQTITVRVDPKSLNPGGVYMGTITITDIDASNSPQTVSIRLRTYDNAVTAVPFGELSTPVDGAACQGSFAVTGWVLDDIGLKNVKIYVKSGNTSYFIGSAIFIEDARPDVEQAFPFYPFNYKAGWGYMLLSYFLPGKGNGTYTVYAKAEDWDGHIEELGAHTITCSNAQAVKPFGTIDIPEQGGTASGSAYTDWGWVLTPMPNEIPKSGSTIDVWVDGKSMGHPKYNLYRSDISYYFPGYANSDGAVGSFVLDTTSLTNGLHTIAWLAVDNAGNTDGIGSRFFTVSNSTSSNSNRLSHGSSLEIEGFPRIPGENLQPVGIEKGYGRHNKTTPVYPGSNGIIRVKIKEMERLVMDLNFAERKRKREGGLRTGISSRSFSGYLKVGEELRALPAGSVLDNNEGVFYWQPGPGFIGSYELVFICPVENGGFRKRTVAVSIGPT